jgi:hypothetical protein
MLNQETANRLSSYLCMTSVQDRQIFHDQIWKDFNALSYCVIIPTADKSRLFL